MNAGGLVRTRGLGGAGPAPPAVLEPQSASAGADEPGVSILSRIRSRGADAQADPEVFRVLRGALESRERLELVPIRTLLPGVRPLVCTIESIDESGVVVSQPTNGGSAGRGLNRFGLYAVTVSHGGRDWTGEVQVVGRAKVRSGGSGVVYGYRLSFPHAFHAIERRRDLRLMFAGDVVREAEMRVLGRTGPILGIIEDLSAGGVKIRCRNAKDAALALGQNVTFRLDVPPPIGEIDETARITGIEPDRQGGDLIVRLQFDTRVESIERFIKNDRPKSPRR